MTQRRIEALRMERQHLVQKAEENAYEALYRDMQPGQNVYWNGFGDPPSLSWRAAFDDKDFNRERQRTHALLKGRFAGGTLGYIIPEDLELFACAYCKPLSKPLPRQLALLELLKREGPLSIQQMKEETGMLVKEITPALHRLQEAFLVYEDQYDGAWDRGWYAFADMFPEACLTRYTRQDALKILMARFAYRHVLFDLRMAKSFYKLPEKDLKAAAAALVSEGTFCEEKGSFFLQADAERLSADAPNSNRFVYAMHRNDFLVKSNEHRLKERFTHPYPDTLYYLLIDGAFRGVAAGKFRYTPEVEDVLPDLPPEEAEARRDEILDAVRALCGENSPIRRYRGQPL